MESRLPGEEEVALIDVADRAGMDQLDRFAEAAPPAALRAARGDALVLARGLHELRAFPDIVGDGLFDIDILAGLHRPDRGQSVPVIGGRDRDRVDVLVLEDAPHVGFDLRALAGLLEDQRAAASVRFPSGSTSAAISTLATGRISLICADPREPTPMMATRTRSLASAQACDAAAEAAVTRK